MRSRPSGAVSTCSTTRQATIARDQVEVVVLARDLERKPAIRKCERLRRRAREPVLAEEGERLRRRRATGGERRDDREQGFAQRLRSRQRLGRGRGLRLRAAREGAQALSRQQVCVRRPFEQALVAVEPVPRRRLVAAGHRIDEVEGRIAADEVALREAVVIDNL